jgi:flagellar biosynthesis chaperone FliJ
MTKRPLLAGSLVLLALASGPSHAQGPESAASLDGLRAEVARVGDSLEQVSRALESLVVLQKTNLLLQQLAMEERRVAPLDRELRDARDHARYEADELTRTTAYRDEVKQRADEALRSGVDPDRDLREVMSQMEREVELQEQQLATTERRIQELENELSRARRALLILEERVTEALEALGP